MCELALVALFAESSLVVFADEVPDAGAVFLGDVVAVRTERTIFALADNEVLTYRAGHLGGRAEGGEGAVEVGVEGEGGGCCGIWMENLVR